MFLTVLCARYWNEENDMVWSGTFSAVHGIRIIFRLTPVNARRTNHGVAKMVKLCTKGAHTISEINENGQGRMRTFVICVRRFHTFRDDRRQSRFR